MSQDVFNLVPSAHIATDEFGNIVYLNKQLKCTGFKLPEVIGLGASLLIGDFLLMIPLIWKSQQ